ncbi:MAG TPA: 3' terminal RNA ribose 2'-O-methyltransferase Hen1 [Gemmatimonadaceae bacterium]|nr:3' terminal RNA ribose 2'-O-methyltransferase Hen1 [Gemmatimonadaceae bacterium]
MMLTITTTHRPATDLGFLLHKNPARAQSFELSFGHAHVFYPEASAERCTAAVMLDVDPVGLVRGRRGPEGEGGLLMQYVNDRPYVASSFLSVAISRVLGPALAGRSKERPELAETTIPLEARIAVLSCRGGEDFLRRLFEPLGYVVTARAEPLDPTMPDWGASRYYTVQLSAQKRLSELLTHLYVLVPVLDDEKHYWVGDDEVEKLLRHGEGWLATHPERELITSRYLKHRHSLVRDAIARLVTEEQPEDEDSDAAERKKSIDESLLERPLSLNEQRLATVLGALRASGAASVVDLGCGEGRLLRMLLDDRQFRRVVGMDVSYRALEIAMEKLKLDRMPAMQRQRIELIHGSLMYRDQRLTGFDAAAVIEVIEHLDPPRLAAFERVAFEFARPRTVVMTTPNAEYNARWPSLPAGRFRHRDHRFEWTRAQFENWAGGVALRFHYTVRFAPVGPVDQEVGSPTQMAIFEQMSGHV